MKNVTARSHVPILEACVIGLVAGLSSVLLSTGVSWLGAFRVHFSDSLPYHFVLPAFGLAGGLIAGLLVEKIAPEASGSGIPQVRACLDRLVMPLNLRIALVKLLGGTIALGSGFFMGREGPTVQLGAALAATLARWLKTGTEYKRQLIAAGAGAGLTAAFNAPLAGITFVLEELLKEIKPSTIVITIIACAVSCTVLNNLSPAHLNASLGVRSEAILLSAQDIPFYLLLGVVTGCIGAGFNRAILASLNFNKKILKIPLFLKIALAGLVSGMVMSHLPETFHNFAGMRALIIAGDTDWQLVLLAFISFLFLTLIAYGSGAPGGLFAPTLTLGSSLGYMIGQIEHSLTGIGSTTAFGMVGMGALFSAVARTPLTAIVITFELTNKLELLLPLMFTCVLSSAIGELVFKEGLYEHLMRWNGINLKGETGSQTNADSTAEPTAESTAEPSILKAHDIMRPMQETFTGGTLVKDALPIFSNSAQRSFVVIDRDKLVGIVTQTDLTKVNDVETLDNLTIAEIMTPHPVAVNDQDSLEEILFLFSRYKYTSLPVTSHDQIKGIILKSDVLKALFAVEENGPPN